MRNICNTHVKKITHKKVYLVPVLSPRNCCNQQRQHITNVLLSHNREILFKRDIRPSTWRGDVNQASCIKKIL